MKEYITVLTESKWVNGSGWSYSTVNNTFESDTFDADAEIDGTTSSASTIWTKRPSKMKPRATRKTSSGR